MSTGQAGAATAERLAAMQSRQGTATGPQQQLAPGVIAAGPAGVTLPPGQMQQPPNIVHQFLCGPSLAALDCGQPSKVLGSPLPLRLLAFVDCQNPARPYVLPPPSSANAARVHVRASLAGQWGQLLASGLPSMAPATDSAEAVTLGAIAQGRCLLAALLASKRPLEAVVESTACLSTLLAGYGTAAASKTGAGAAGGPLLAALCTFLLLHAEALRLSGCWREAVFVSHGLMRLALAAVAGGTSSTAVAAAADRVAAGAAAATWASSQPFSSEASAPVAERCLAALEQSLQLQALPRAHLPRILACAAICTSGALSDAGYMVAAGNALAEAAAVLTSIAAAEEAAGAAPAVELLPPAAQGTAAGPCSFPLRLSTAPAWLWAGLTLSTQAALQRTAGREADAGNTQAALEALPVWSRAAAVMRPRTDIPGATMADTLTATPLAEQYCVAVLAVTRASGLVQAGKPADALAVAEVAAVCAAGVVKSSLAPFVLGDSSSGGGAEVAATSDTPGLDDAGVVGPDAACASACVLSWAPDPCELLEQAVLMVSDCVKRMPPTAPNQPNPLAVAVGVLESAIRACPPAALRPDLILTLCNLYDGRGDAGAAILSKRAVQATAGRFGLGHIEPGVFRLLA